MSYTKLTDFASKDALLSGNPSKLLRGTELGAEFDAIQVADALNIKPDTVTAATSKTTPVDADLLTLFDSASTFSLKKLTWANLKATIKTYFDTLYAASGGSALVGHIASGTGAVATTVQTKLRESVSVFDFGATDGGDISAAVGLALAAGHKRIEAVGSFLVNSLITVSQTGVTLDFSNATLTAATGLNASLIRLSGTRCTLLVGTIDGNAAGQTSSSFGIDMNGGSYNKVKGGRVTNCKTYGVYITGAQYASVDGVESDNNQQAGIAGDSGGSNCVGVKVRNVVVHDNGLSGTGATSGLYFEGDSGAGTWFSELDIDGVIAYGNRGAGVAGQRWEYYSLRNVKARANYQQGIALLVCFYGNGGDFTLNGNDVGALAGYENGFSLDDTAVTPPSQYNTFDNIFSASHAGFAVIERGTANNNTFLGVESVSDGGVSSTVGANTTLLNRNSWYGTQRFRGKFLGNTASSGVGYGAGSGGVVTQATSKATGVTLNFPSGRITTAADALAGGAVNAFTLTNSAIESTDILVFNVASGATAGAYLINARPANGSAAIEIRNVTAGSLSEAIVIVFSVIKSANN